MSSRSARISSYTLMAALCLLLPISETRAATGGCSALPRVPSVIEIDQGLQQELRLPVGITRAAVGDPKIADVHLQQALPVQRPRPGIRPLPKWAWPERQASRLAIARPGGSF